MQGEPAIKRGVDEHQDSQSESKRSSRLVVGISAVALVLLIALLFLGYQTYQLNQKVSKLESDSPNSLSFSTPFQSDKRALKGNAPGFDDWDFDSLNPFEDMKKMHERINKMFGNSWSRFHSVPQFQDLMDEDGFSPSLDIEETDTEYIVTVNVPGAEESNINVKVEGSMLTVSGTTNKTSSHQNSQGTSLSKERFVGQFSRSLSLPEEVDPQDMKTDYKDGVLTIRLQKQQ